MITWIGEKHAGSLCTLAMARKFTDWRQPVNENRTNRKEIQANHFLFSLLSSTPSFFTEMFPLAGEQIILIGFIHSIFLSVNGTRKKTATFGRLPMTTNCLRPRRFIALGTTGFPWTYEWMKLGTLLKVEQRCWLFQFIHFSFQKLQWKGLKSGKVPPGGLALITTN